MRTLRRLYELSPKDVVRKMRRRLVRRDSSVFDLEEVAQSPKQIRVQRAYDFLSRYEAIIKRNHPGWEEIRFEARRVLEIGCGPTLGWGPLAIFLGAECYVSAEPLFNKHVLTDSVLVQNYFLELHKDLSAIYGPKMTFDRFLQALKERTKIHNQTLLEADIEGSFDVILSNSCLEHVNSLEANVERLKELSSVSHCFVHLVDFGNHRATQNPFSGIYSVEPDEYFEKHGRGINLARPPDILRAFRNAGFECALIPYYQSPENFNEEIGSYWRNRYSEDELFLKAALLAGPL